MSSKINLRLDVTKTGIQNPLVKVRQGDGNFETLHVTVTSNGEPMDLQGWTITFMGTTAGNHKIADANVKVVEAPNGIFDYTPSKAWGADVGEFTVAYFKFAKGDGVASSANFRVNVIEAVDLTQEEAQHYISVFDAAVAEARTHLENSLASVTQSIANADSAVNTISSSVTALGNRVDDYNDKLATVKVGGRNLLLDTKKGFTGVGDNSVNGNFDAQGGRYYLAGGKKVADLYNQYGSTGYLTLSFDWVASGSTISGQFNPQWKGTPWGVPWADSIDASVVKPSNTNTSGHYTFIIPLNSNGYSAGTADSIMFKQDNLQGNVTISNVKLEAGNTATDWTPAPEDIMALENSHQEEIDKWVKYIQDLPDGSPAGVYASLNELKATNPDRTRIYVTTDNNSWNYWNGTAWVVGGVYQGGVVSDSEIERIIMLSSSTTDGQNVEAISAISTNGRSGGNSFYVVGKVFAPNFLSRVAFYTFKAGTANVGIFSTDVTDINVDGNVALKLLAHKTVSTHVGFNFVNFNLDMKKNYLIGISVDGISFVTGTNYRTFQTTSFTPTIGNDYNLNFTLGAGLGLSVFAMTKPAMQPALLYSKNNIRPMTLFSQNDNKDYPIVFDMTTNLVTISGLLGVVGHHGNKAIDYVPLNGTYTMPVAGGSTDVPVNYYMFYDLDQEKVIVRSSVGGLSPYNTIDVEKLLFVVGFSVRNLSQQKSNVDIFSTNKDYITVIVSHANGTPNSFEDVVTFVSQRLPTYNKTYVAIGDSLTEGEDPNNGYAPAIGHRYTDWAGVKLGVKAINMGVGGSTVRNNGANSVYARITSVPKADFVSILAGTNDFGTNTPIGNYGGDVTKEFKAAFDNVVRYMMTRDEQLIIITPPNRKQQTNEIGLSLKDYVDVELEVAKKYGVPVIDLYNTYQYHTAFENFYAKYMPDGLHPSAAGYDLMSKRIVAGIKQLINV